ncbi:MAG TPA: DUF4142 domain-containing protein [Nannocystaceae bacterium]|nr:DUF4142 domain-containing protein [Nannocystaceae bacterium]
MTRSTLFTIAALALIACKNQPPAEDTSTPPDQSYSTVPTQESIEASADADAERREQEAAAAEANKPKEPPPLSDTDKTFVDTAAKAGMAEVDISTAVLEKVKKKTVKEFAQKMIDDHSKANEELKVLCASRNIMLPTEIDEETKTKRDELLKKTGSKLEKAYVDIMLDDHRKAVELFRNESQSGGDPELKQWAGATLPKLEEHLAHVEMLAAGKTYKPKNTGQVSATNPTPTDASAEKTTAPAPSK